MTSQQAEVIVFSHTKTHLKLERALILTVQIDSTRNLNYLLTYFRKLENIKANGSLQFAETTGIQRMQICSYRFVSDALNIVVKSYPRLYIEFTTRQLYIYHLIFCIFNCLLNFMALISLKIFECFVHFYSLRCCGHEREIF